jgi:Triosephosphate isomerase
MIKDFRIRKPFFELGPKTYLYGDAALDLALCADELCGEYPVDIIFSAQYTDIAPIAARARRLRLFAQHMDPIEPGRGIGAVLPEALRHAGAEGVLLNHAERPLALSVLAASIRRAGEVGLATLVCAGDADESAAVACLGPDIVLAESPALIGVGKRGENDAAEIRRINEAVRAIAPEMPVLHGAGISDARDVYEVIKSGADATGSTSGVLKAADPKRMLREMIEAMWTAYRERTGA